MEKHFVIVAYGDLIDYTDWSRKVVNLNEQIWPMEEREAFMGKFYEEIRWFVLSSDFKVKYLGDGFMILRELGSRGTRVHDALRFLFGIYKLGARMQGIIKKSRFPPKGFRLRVVAGMAGKVNMPDPNSKDKVAEEYTSPAIDMSERLLHVEKEWPLICHGSVVNLIGHNYKNLIFSHLKNVKYDKKKVTPEDAKDLWSFGFEKGFHIA